MKTSALPKRPADQPVMTRRKNPAGRDWLKPLTSMWRAMSSSASHDCVPLVEELEPRLLYSADFATSGLLLAGGSHVVEQRVLDTGGEFVQAQASQVDATLQQHELIFIDSSVPDIDGLLAGLDTNGKNVEIVMLDASKDGIEQISAALSGRTDISAIHIFSHGSDGELQLGSTTLDSSQLEARSTEISHWGDALTGNGDILLYGCDVAADASGEAFVQRLAALTRADVSASSNLTGNAALGGDWVLEYQVGQVQAPTVASASALAGWQNDLLAYSVTNTNDSGLGSLREAITLANLLPGADSITFNIGSGVQTISLNSALPTITGPLTIDGTTQGGYAGAPLIVLDGTSAGGNANGLVLGAGSSGSTIQGLAINNFKGYGIAVHSNNNVVAGNYIGLAADGLTAAQNRLDGIYITGANNIIGGSTASARNVISSNGDDGINIAGGNFNTIQGNLVGLAADGVTVRGNGTVGIWITGGASNSSILGNTIAGHTNYSGIEVNGTSTGTVIQGNYIGTNASGATTLANGIGITLWNGATNTTIGGVNPGEGNTIAYNATAGIDIEGATTGDNSILGNSIYSNTGLGIDLGGFSNGVTANDTGDADTGPNGLQNFPLLSSVVSSGTQITLTGTLNSLANTNYRIEFFASAGADPSGYGEGARYLGFADVLTDASGNASFSTTISALVSAGESISATATRTDGSYTTFFATSEFSKSTTLNFAPVLNGANNLSPINEDPASNSGTLVSALINTFASDVNGGTLGIAVTAVDNSNGSWEYSTNGGSSWTAFGAPSMGSARLLAADANTRVRFVPNPNWNGTVSNGLTFYAWDQTSGTAGGTAILSQNVFDNFNSVSYGNNNGTASWSTSWVESDSATGGAAGGEIRVVAGGSLQMRASINADSIYREVDLTGASTATLSFNYASTLGGADQVDLQISNDGGSSYTTLANFGSSSNTGSGTLSFDIGSYISANTRVRFVVVGTEDNLYLNIDNLQIAYGTPYTGGSTAFSLAAASSSIVVTAVNDAPVLNLPATQLATVDTPVVFSTANGNRISVSDVDAGNNPVEITLDIKEGTLTLGSTAGLTFSTGDGTADGKMVFIGTLADINAAMDGMVYTPKSNYGGNGAKINITANDLGNSGSGGAQKVTGTIAFNFKNVAPVAVDDTYNAAENGTLTVTASAGLLSNDRDANQNALTAVLVTGPANGTLALAADGSFTYTPNTNFIGIDSFTYKANDGLLDSGVATVTLDVYAVNTAPTISGITALTSINDTASASPFSGVTIADADSPAQVLAVSITLDSAAKGTLSNLGGGTYDEATGIYSFSGTATAATTALRGLVFTPTANRVAPGSTESTIFTLSVSDSIAAPVTDSSTTVTTTSVNDAPTISGITALTSIDDTGTTTPFFSVIIDDVDNPAQTQTVTITLDTAAKGTLSNLGGGSYNAGSGVYSFSGTAADATTAVRGLVFTPTANRVAPGSTESTTFTLSVDDGVIATPVTDNNTVVVATSVNDAPTGSATAILTDGTEDTAYTVSTADLLAGFSDVDGDTMSVANLVASDGSVVDNLDGTYTITPSANFNGAVTLNYDVIDGNGGSIAASQSYTLDAVNDAPTGSASAILANGTEDTAYTVSASDLLAGFSDVDIATNGQVLSVSSLTASDGSVVDNLDGTYTITPSANFNGAVTLNYNVIDGNGGSIAASQSYTLAAVNDAPTGSASAILANGTEDTAYTVSASDLLAGFSDVDIATNGQVLSVSSLTASDGSVVDNLDGTYTITPSANFNGAVTLNYNVIDGNGGSIAASQSYTLDAVNDAPTGSASAILANGTEDTAYTVSASDLLAGFSDVDSDTTAV